MHKVPSWISISAAVGLSIISIWWIFFIFWRLGFVHLVQQLAFRYETPDLSQEVVSRSTARAIEYATKGSTQTEDIFFNKNEVSHLLDVSSVYQPTRVFLGIGALISFGWLILIIRRFNKIPKGIFLIARNLQLFISVILLLSLIIFPIFFVRFHEVLFPQGNWSFPANSILIQIFPESFWKLLLICLFVGVTAFGVLYHIVSEELRDD